MDDLPLPLQLEWDRLRDQYGFTDEWLDRKKIARADRESVPPVIAEGSAVSQTVNLAAGWFSLLADVHFSRWLAARAPYEDYRDRLKTIRSKIITALRELHGDGDWFDRVCLRHVDATLEHYMAGARNRARVAAPGAPALAAPTRDLSQE
jgi:hypothetical protein